MRGKELGWWLYAEELIELGAAEAIDRAFRGWDDGSDGGLAGGRQ